MWEYLMKFYSASWLVARVPIITHPKLVITLPALELAHYDSSEGNSIRTGKEITYLNHYKDGHTVYISHMITQVQRLTHWAAYSRSV